MLRLGMWGWQMQVTHTVAYAVQAASMLARMPPNCPVPSRELAELGDMPNRFLLQILRSLATHGILESTVGVSGGYFLARPASMITLLDIAEACDFHLQPSVPDIRGLSALIRQQLMAIATNASIAAQRELRRVTLADLANGADPPIKYFMGPRIA
jgi:Rrf2 family protein